MWRLKSIASGLPRAPGFALCTLNVIFWFLEHSGSLGLLTHLNSLQIDTCCFLCLKQIYSASSSYSWSPCLGLFVLILVQHIQNSEDSSDSHCAAYMWHTRSLNIDQHIRCRLESWPTAISKNIMIDEGNKVMRVALRKLFAWCISDYREE